MMAMIPTPNPYISYLLIPLRNIALIKQYISVELLKSISDVDILPY